MLRKLPPLFAVLILCSATVVAAPEAGLVTRYDLTTGIGETVLENGLTVLTLERHTAPIVAVHLWYRVGSADEVAGATGIAHFLEHMMFKGTDRYERGEIDRITLKLGGSNNAATSRDYTHFHFTFASDRWEKALEIESSRIRNLRLDPDDFASEKKVVIEELQMGRDSPWGEIDETVEATAFLAHPYRHPIVGWRGDIENLTRERMKAFYDLHYHPRNATLVLVGDFDTRRALSRVQTLLGGIPAGPERERARTAEPAQRGERRITVRRDSRVGRVEILWHGTRLRDRDAAVLDVAAHVLSGSKSSRLTRRLVEEEGIATSVNAWADNRREPGLFWVWAEAKVGRDPEAVLKASFEEVARLRDEDVSADEVERAKTTILTDMVFGLATADSQAQHLGWLATTADWRLAGRMVERYRSVTPADVRRVANRYLVGDQRTIAVSPPTGGEGGGARRPTGNRAPRRREGPAAVAKGVPVRLSPTVVELENGVTLLLLRHTAAPVTAIRAWVDAGVLREKRPGLAYLTGRCLLEGAAGRDGIALSREFERIGATVSASPTGLTARCLSENAAALMPLITDVLLRPDFPEEKVSKLRERTLSEIRAERDDPATLAAREFDRLVYGDHPRAWPDHGNEESVKALTREDVLAHYRGRYVPGRAIVSVVSDLPLAETEAMLRAAFGGWKGKGTADPKMPAIPEPAARRLHIDRDTDQANVYIGHRGIRRNDPDYHELLVMDYVLGKGPGFTDRLSRTIRDRDGLAYDVHASMTSEAGTEPGTFYAYIGTSAEQEKRAVAAIVREIERIRTEPVEEGELADAKAYLTGSYVFRYETAEQIVGKLVMLRVFGLGFDYPTRYAERVNAVTAEDVLAVAKRHLLPDKLITVSVGPAGK